MPARALFLPARGQLDLLCEYVRSLVQRNKTVVVVTANHSAKAIRAALREHGVPADRAVLVDATGGHLGVDADDEHTHLVAAPTLLELIALRVNRILRGRGHHRPHVVVSDVDTLALHNPPAAIEELFRYVVNHLADARMPIDFVIHEESRMPEPLQHFLRHFLTEGRHFVAVPAHVRSKRAVTRAGSSAGSA